MRSHEPLQPDTGPTASPLPWLSMLKVASATAVYGIFHSAVASIAAKQAAARLFGSRNRNGLYRVFYIGQSLFTFALLAAYVWRLPNRDLYHARGRLAKLMHAGQFAALLYATWAARQVGIRRITGLESFPAWVGGDRDVPREPEAQGPPSTMKPEAIPSALSPGAVTPSTLSRCPSSGSGPA